MIPKSNTTNLLLAMRICVSIEIMYLAIYRWTIDLLVQVLVNIYFGTFIKARFI